MNRLKKNALRLALAAAIPTAAHAQADYAAYGVADFSYGRFEPSGQLPANRFNSNSLSASFVGVNGRYGLDGGWTPGITLESFVRFQDFQGGRNDRDPALSRNAFVSLASPYGTLRVGRLQTFLFDATVRFNALANSPAFSPALRHVFLAGNLLGVQGDFYWNRAVSYQTPASLEGVQANVMAAQGETSDRGDLAGATVVVNQGLLAVGVSAQRVHVDNGIDDPTDETVWQLGASYNFGWARVFGLATATHDRGLDVKSRLLSAGVVVPLGPGNVHAQIAVADADGPAVDRRQTTASIGYVYPWDSTLDVYALAMDDRVRGQTRGLSFAAGARWRF
jgi:predicted porin